MSPSRATSTSPRPPVDSQNEVSGADLEAPELQKAPQSYEEMWRKPSLRVENVDEDQYGEYGDYGEEEYKEIP